MFKEAISGVSESIKLTTVDSKPKKCKCEDLVQSASTSIGTRSPIMQDFSNAISEKIKSDSEVVSNVSEPENISGNIPETKSGATKNDSVYLPILTTISVTTKKILDILDKVFKPSDKTESVQPNVPDNVSPKSSIFNSSNVFGTKLSSPEIKYSPLKSSNVDLVKSDITPKVTNDFTKNIVESFKEKELIDRGSRSQESILPESIKNFTQKNVASKIIDTFKLSDSTSELVSDKVKPNVDFSQKPLDISKQILENNKQTISKTGYNFIDSVKPSLNNIPEQTPARPSIVAKTDLNKLEVVKQNLDNIQEQTPARPSIVAKTDLNKLEVVKQNLDNIQEQTPARPSITQKTSKLDLVKKIPIVSSLINSPIVNRLVEFIKPVTNNTQKENVITPDTTEQPNTVEPTKNDNSSLLDTGIDLLSKFKKNIPIPTTVAKNAATGVNLTKSVVESGKAASYIPRLLGLANTATGAIGSSLAGIGSSVLGAAASMGSSIMGAASGALSTLAPVSGVAAAGAGGYMLGKHVINPLIDKGLSAITGEKTDLGSWLYDKFNPETAKKVKESSVTETTHTPEQIAEYNKTKKSQIEAANTSSELVAPLMVAQQNQASQIQQMASVRDAQAAQQSQPQGNSGNSNSGGNAPTMKSPAPAQSSPKLMVTPSVRNQDSTFERVQMQDFWPRSF